MTNQDFNPLFESLRQTANLVVKGLHPHVKLLTAGLADSMKVFAETVRRAVEEHELNIRTGWWYPNYIVDDLPDNVVHEALLNESKTKAFTKLVVRECKRNDYAQLRIMHDRWQSYEFLKAGRKRILADIITAHLNKQYTLSIPVAMAQVDYFHHAMFPKEKELHIDYTSRESVAASQQLNFAKHFIRKIREESRRMYTSSYTRCITILKTCSTPTSIFGSFKKNMTQTCTNSAIRTIAARYYTAKKQTICPKRGRSNKYF